MANVIGLEAYKNTLRRIDGFSPTGTEKNYSQIKVTFTDSDWKKCSAIAAHFFTSADNIVTSTVTLASGKSTVTFDIPLSKLGVSSSSTQTQLFVGLSGTYTSNSTTVTISTNIVKIDINKGLAVQDDANTELYEQIIALVSDYLDVIDDKIADKADSATTLAGYGIEDAMGYQSTNSSADECLEFNTLYHCFLTGEGYVDLINVDGTTRHGQYKFRPNGEISYRSRTRSSTSESFGDWSDWTQINNWNAVANKPTTLAGYGITDAYTKTKTDSLLAEKADSATTLAGYGITNAYTKTKTDSLLADKADDLTLSVTFDENDVPLYCTTATSFSGGAFATNAAKVKYAYLYSSGTLTLDGGCFTGCANLTDIYTNLSSLTVNSDAYPSGVDPTIHYEADFEIINRIIKALIYLSDTKADTETVNSALAAKADTETGSGTLSPATSASTGSVGTFIYAKSGNIVTVTLHMSAFTAGKNYVSMSGLLYKAAKAVTKTFASMAALTTSNVTVNVRVDDDWIYFTRTSGTFADGETLTVTLTYITE